MPYTISAAQSIGWGAAYTIPDIIKMMSGNSLPDSIAFPNLDYPLGASYFVASGMGLPLMGTRINEVSRAAGLACGGAVLYADPSSGKGYIFNARAADNKNYGFDSAMAVMAFGDNPPVNTICMAYAHAGDADESSRAALDYFVKKGIPSENILEITQLPMGQFGMNNLFQIGY
jgi:hypothetical protein